MPREQQGRRARRAYRLVALGGVKPLQFIIGRHKTIIGRDPESDLALDDDLVSKRHAILRRRFATLRLTDLESQNGTFVNGVRISPSTTLKPGDEIRFGATRFALLSPIGAGNRNSSRPSLRALAWMVIVLAIIAFGVSEFILNRRLAAENASLIAGRAKLAARPSAAPTSSSGALAAMTPAARALTVATPRPPRAIALESARPALAATPARTSAPRAIEPEWLARVNYYRRTANVPPVTQDPVLSRGDLAHAEYLVRNKRTEIKDGSAGADMHTENAAMPGYTPAGLNAARSSDVDEWWYTRKSAPPPNWAIDGWMTAPFHRTSILNPRLHQVGYGQFCDKGICAAALNVGTDADVMPYGGMRYPAPVIFPPASATIAMRSFIGEWPNPLTSCLGYKDPAGLPITVQFGAWITPHLSAYSFSRLLASGQRLGLDACGFDANTYVNPTALVQNWARKGLKDAGAVVIIPRRPLVPGARYEVSMTVDGKPYAWSFAVARGTK